MIATAGSDEKVAWALENGADEGINHVREDVLGKMRDHRGGRRRGRDRYHGETPFRESLKLAGHGGRVAALTNVALEESMIDTRDFYPNNVTIYGFQMTNLMQHLGYDPRGDLEELADLVARGQLKVNMDKVFPLKGAGDAHRHLEACRNTGKVMIHPQG